MAASAAVVTLAGCSGRLSVFDAAGAQAARIEFLTLLMIAGLGAIWLAMVALGLVAMIWPARLRRVPFRHWLIWGGLVLPLAVMVPLFVWAVVMTDDLRRDDGNRVIRAEAFMWGWQFTYPEAGGEGQGADGSQTAGPEAGVEGTGAQQAAAPTSPAQSLNLLYLPLDEPVTLEIRSRDVIHSLWVPQLAGKIDAVPGHVTTLPVTALRAGLFEGQCAEFCGLGHTEMRFVVDVRPADGFAAALAGLTDGTTPARPQDIPDAARTEAGPAARVAPVAPEAGDAGLPAAPAADPAGEAGRPAAASASDALSADPHRASAPLTGAASTGPTGSAGPDPGAEGAAGAPDASAGGGAVMPDAASDGTPSDTTPSGPSSPSLTSAPDAGSPDAPALHRSQP